MSTSWKKQGRVTWDELWTAAESHMAWVLRGLTGAQEQVWDALPKVGGGRGKRKHIYSKEFVMQSQHAQRLHALIR